MNHVVLYSHQLASPIYLHLDCVVEVILVSTLLKYHGPQELPHKVMSGDELALS